MRDEILKKFGKRLKIYRKEANLSQEELSSVCGLHRTYISSIERGKRNISLLNTVKIANALGIDLSILLEDM